MATYAHFKDLIPDHIDHVDMPDDSYWARDSMVCDCGEDSGWRYVNVYYDDPEAHCDGCGAIVRHGDGSPSDSAVPVLGRKPGDR